MFSNAIIEPLQKTFAYKGCKITAQFFFFFSANFALLAGFFGIGATIHIGGEMLHIPYEGFLKTVIKLTILLKRAMKTIIWGTMTHCGKAWQR